MKNIFGIVLLISTHFAAYAVDLSVPQTVKGDPGDFISVPATTSGAVVKWVMIDPGIKLFPVSLLKDTKTAVVTGNTPGSYRLLCYTSDANGPSDPVIATVTINGPPTPVDPLAATLQAAYNSETDPNKVNYLNGLAGLYSQAPLWASDPKTTTWGQLYDTIEAAAKHLTINGKLSKVQGVLAAEIKKQFPVTTQQSIADSDRILVGQLFTRIANLLGGVK